MMDKEMEILLAEKELMMGDKLVTVKRIALLDTIRLAHKLSDIVSLVINSGDTFNVAIGKVLYDGKLENGEMDENVNSIRVAGVIEIIGLIGDDAVAFLKDLIFKSTNLTLDEIENVDSVFGIDLFEAIYEVNKGFFSKCMSKLKEKTAKKKDTKKEK